MKRALITGITGQDGSYLAELLLEKGYEVHGTVRRSSSIPRTRIDHLELFERGEDRKLHLHYADLSDGGSLTRLLYDLQPDEVYNLAAQSHVRVSFDVPEYTADVTGVGSMRLLEGILRAGLAGKVRYYQASSSEMFGKVRETPQRETTPFHPRSPYACSKVFAHWATVNYREAHGLFACCGILFNHESPRRGESFVTRKITLAAARIRRGLQEDLWLGNLVAKRDWGYAPEYVEGMWRMLQEERPGDYVLATGETHSVEEFLEASFQALDLDWRDHVRFDPLYTRPSEVDRLVGDASRARRELGWEAKVRMRELARIMTRADLEALDAAPREARAGLERTPA